MAVTETAALTCWSLSVSLSLPLSHSLGLPLSLLLSSSFFPFLSPSSPSIHVFHAFSLLHLRFLWLFFFFVCFCRSRNFLRNLRSEACNLWQPTLWQPQQFAFICWPNHSIAFFSSALIESLQQFPTPYLLLFVSAPSPALTPSPAPGGKSG